MSQDTEQQEMSSAEEAEWFIDKAFASLTAGDFLTAKLLLEKALTLAPDLGARIQELLAQIPFEPYVGAPPSPRRRFRSGAPAEVQPEVHRTPHIDIPPEDNIVPGGIFE